MRVIVVGFGAFGLSFARTMYEMGHEVIVIERDGALVDRHAECATRAVQGDATDPAVLERVGAASADAAVIGTGEDLATTILATLTLRDVGIEYVYAKVASTNAARALEALNVTDTIFAEREAGFRLAHRILSRSVLEYEPIAPGYSIQEMSVPEPWAGRTLRDLSAREKHGIQVIAVRDSLTGDVAIPPDPGRPLKDSDSVILVGGDEVLSGLGESREE